MRAALLLLLLSGCATPSATIKDAATRGAEINDDVLVAATFALCRGVSVGAWLRAYGSRPDKAQAWRTLCSDEPITLTPR